MAQFLDTTGLEIVAQNINSKILIVTNVISSPIDIHIKNSKAPSLGDVYITTNGKILAHEPVTSTGAYSIYYYTSWGPTSEFKSSKQYGTETSTGVVPNNGALIYCTSTKRLYVYNNGLREILCENPAPVWTTVWQKGSGTIQNKTPFIDADGYITKVERTTNSVTGNFIWKITILNNDGETQQFNVTRGNYIISDGINLKDGEEGSFCIELSLAAPNGVYTVTY